MQKKNKSVTNWCVQTPKTLDHQLEDAVEKGVFSSKSELIRSSVRSTIKEINLKEKCK